MGFFLPRLSALSQQRVCHCFLGVLNLSFDDLLLTHGTKSSVKFTELCEAAKDLPRAFCLTEERNSVEQGRKRKNYLKRYNLY